MAAKLVQWSFMLFGDDQLLAKMYGFLSYSANSIYDMKNRCGTILYTAFVFDLYSTIESYHV